MPFLLLWLFYSQKVIPSGLSSSCPSMMIKLSPSAFFPISFVLFLSKVILSTHAVVANGGLIALNGSHAVALAANDLSVPVVCVTGLFKVLGLCYIDLRFDSKWAFSLRRCEVFCATCIQVCCILMIQIRRKYSPPQVIDLPALAFRGYLVSLPYPAPFSRGNSPPYPPILSSRGEILSPSVFPA